MQVHVMYQANHNEATVTVEDDFDDQLSSAIAAKQSLPNDYSPTDSSTDKLENLIVTMMSDSFDYDDGGGYMYGNDRAVRDITNFVKAIVGDDVVVTVELD